MIPAIRSKRALAAAVAALVLALAAGVAAQGPGGPGRRHGGFGPGLRGGIGVPLGQLGLTDAQREQVRDVMQRHREEMQAASTRLADAHRAQREAVETVPVNEALIRSSSQSLANAQTDMALLQARIHTEVWSLLTPEQQAKAKELKDRREERAKERRQRMQQRRQQG